MQRLMILYEPLKQSHQAQFFLRRQESPNWSWNPSPLIENEFSLLYTKQNITENCREPDGSTLHVRILFKISFYIIFPPTPSLSCSLVPSGYRTRLLYWLVRITLEGEWERIAEEATVFYDSILHLLERLLSPCIREKIRIQIRNSIAILADNVTRPRYVIARIQGKPQSEFEILIAVTMKSTIFWFVTSLNSV
jgi:hypothetical protein